MSRPFFHLDEVRGRVGIATAVGGWDRPAVAGMRSGSPRGRGENRCRGATPRDHGVLEFFSAGAELEEIAALDRQAAYEFSKMGQALMQAVEQFRAPVFAAVSGYCMGGGLDLALACHRRIAAPNAVLGHRGAALGLITGWGGTQRLPQLHWRQRRCSGNFCCGGEDQRAPGIGNWVGGSGGG